MSANLGVYLSKHSPLPQPQWLPSPASPLSQIIKDLGVLLGYDMQAASHQEFTGIYQAISAKALGSSGLSSLGRVHVAKQVLSSYLAAVSSRFPTALRTVA